MVVVVVQSSVLHLALVCCFNLASARFWKDLQIFKSADAHLVSGGMEHKSVLSRRCLVGLGDVCVHLLYVYIFWGETKTTYEVHTGEGLW